MFAIVAEIPIEVPVLHWDGALFLALLFASWIFFFFVWAWMYKPKPVKKKKPIEVELSEFWRN